MTPSVFSQAGAQLLAPGGLGHGGGFFDRTLAALEPTPLSIGVGFELARVDSIHPEAHDMRLDAIVTEAAVRHTRPIRTR